MKFLDSSTLPSFRRGEGEKFIQEAKPAKFSRQNVVILKAALEKGIKKESRNIPDPSHLLTKLALAVTHLGFFPKF